MIETYFLNKEYDYLKPPCPTCPNIECLHTDRNTLIPLPSQITFCFRSQPLVYENYLSSWSTIAGFGTIRSDFIEMEEGVLYGVWETGPWLGVKFYSDPSYKWVALGENFLHDLQIWRHSCFSADFGTGEVKLVENGKMRFKTVSEDFKELRKTMNFVSAGCFYRTSGAGYQSMYGRVTDVQIFGKILSNLDMEKITGCQITKKGDVLSWETAPWVIRGPKKNILKESLHFESLICNPSRKSYHLIPQRKNFNSESLDVCQKVSAQVAGHTTKDEFTTITEYLSGENMMEAQQCLSRMKRADNSSELSTWLGNSDKEEEGVWRNWFTMEKVMHNPWLQGRPYAGGVSYNCMRLQLEVVDTGSTYGRINSATLTDEECENGDFCPICEISHPIMKIFVRGLCPMSIFNNVYMYNINKEGIIMYLGEQTSFITFDSQAKMWMWRDKKNNNSMATSSSPYSSLLIGVHLVDFHGVVDDACQADGVVRRLKFTTCVPGQFTCNDGQCVGIEKRCDQTSHCNDQSDEENCRIINMKTSYNDKIAPFSYSQQQKRFLSKYF